MTVVQRTFWGAVIVAVGLPAIGALVQGLWSLVVGFMAIGLLWLVIPRRRWTGDGFFVLCVAGIALAVWIGVAMGWLIGGMVAALAAWDLDAFGARLASVRRVENESALVDEHLRRLAVVSAVGFLLAAAALFVRVRLSFGVALLLALVAVLGLGHVLRGIGE